jgi:uncharacterized membrane protein SpoIIM required for sporulation
VDLDAFTAVHRPEWERLEALVKRRRLDGAESDELVRLYQAVATHLSTVRSAAPDPVTVARLSELLARARTRISGAHEAAWSDVARYVAVTVPAALYRIRWWIAGVTVAFVALALVSGVWVATEPEALAQMGTPSQQEDYVQNAFASYYDPQLSFAAMVWTNNAWIALQTIAFGITGVWPVWVLGNNAVQVGATGGMMAAHGELGLFLQLIAPHGLLELTSIFVAGAAGLKIFWTWVDPGPRPRSVALASEGRALFTVGVGLVGALALSGLVEGFVTGSNLPWWLKIVIGALALAAFLTYFLVLGRRAVRAGETGDLDVDRAGAVLPTAG